MRVLMQIGMAIADLLILSGLVCGIIELDKREVEPTFIAVFLVITGVLGGIVLIVVPWVYMGMGDF